MPELTPLLRDQRKIDVSHLKLLAIFHYVLAGLSIVGLGFIFLHWFLMHSLFDNPQLWANHKGGPPPKEFFAIFKWLYAFGAAIVIGGGVVNLISGVMIQKRRARIFSLIVAGLDCFCFPFGMVLGVFTFIVLLRNSVEEIYAAGSNDSPPPL